MGKKRKNRYHWACTGCGHEIERLPPIDDLEVMDATRRLIIDAAAVHLKECSAQRFEDVDGYFAADACEHPYVRPVVRSIRKIAFVTIGRNKTLHIDYGAENTPCGLKVGRPGASEVEVADFYGDRLPKFRLCKTCLAYRRATVADEMEILETQFGRANDRLKN